MRESRYRLDSHRDLRVQRYCILRIESERLNGNAPNRGIVSRSQRVGHLSRLSGTKS
jgi:hypothetical protein